MNPEAIEEVKSPQTREDQVPRRDQVNALVQQSNSFASGALSVFRDGYVPVPLSLSPAEQAQWRFINRAVQEHLSRAPCFGALGTYMLDDNSLLQCVAYQEKPSFPPTQYDYPVLGSRTDDLCFEFFPRDPRPNLSPLAPNWISLQSDTTPEMSLKMKQVLWNLSRVLSLSPQVEPFTSIHHRRKIVDITTANGSMQIPVYSLRPGNEQASFASRQHYLESLCNLKGNRPLLGQILGFYKKELEAEHCGQVQDWLWVFLAYLQHFAEDKRTALVDAYSKYFHTLAEVEEKAALYARVLWYRDTAYATMTKDAQNAAEEMFTSIKQRVKFKFEFPTDAELRCARLFGSKMHLWFFASYSMPLDVHKHHEVYIDWSLKASLVDGAH
ncbi:hypothetical protein B0H10DRAFT_940655 [Mycena sp. CBHHK59/15]|nr:hypothetical protein B0H10DRAFT_940655 [Mycena sp. CBHHK59/15]